jgi:hypothetical protein
MRMQLLIQSANHYYTEIISLSLLESPVTVAW